MTLLAQYYQADTDPAVFRAMAGDWWDVLGTMPQGAVAVACTDYLRDEARIRPTPGAIRALALKAMQRDKRLAPSLPQPDRLRIEELPRERVTPEQAARILDENGLTPRRLAAIAMGRRMPAPVQAEYEDQLPAPVPSVEEILARPYTDEERRRMASLRGSHAAAENFWE